MNTTMKERDLTPCSEEEAPPDIGSGFSQNESVPPTETNVQSEPLKWAEFQEKRVQNSFSRGMQALLTGYGFYLMVFCLSSIFGLYILDVVLINKGLKNSTLLTPIFELLKFILSSLIGFLFANNLEKGKQ